jgi:hypothetical protein
MLIWGGIADGVLDSGGLYVADTSPDQDGDGYTECAGDCNEADPTIHPGAVELCDGLDNDCDGVADDGANAACDDHNACTDDQCMGTTGCVHANNTRACDDGTPCTSGDTCSGGACTGTPRDGIACDDRNVCTTGDFCSGGVCHGTPRSCDDHNPCSDDSCNPAWGCDYAPNTLPCDDSNPCTSGDRCSGYHCGGEYRDCSDGNDRGPESAIILTIRMGATMEISARDLTSAMTEPVWAQTAWIAAGPALRGLPEKVACV